MRHRAPLVAAGLALFLSCHRETRLDTASQISDTSIADAHQDKHLEEHQTSTTTAAPTRTVIEEFYPPAAAIPDAGIAPVSEDPTDPPAHGALKSRTVIDTGPVVQAITADAHADAATTTETHADVKTVTTTHATTKLSVGPGWKFYIALVLIVGIIVALFIKFGIPRIHLLGG